MDTKERQPVSESGIRRILAGDEFVLCRVYEELHEAFARRAAADFFRGDQLAADDAFNKAFQQLLKSLSSLRFEGRAQFFAYFKRILVSRCIDGLRQSATIRAWEQEHVVWTFTLADGTVEEIVEHIPGPDTIAQEEDYVEREAAWRVAAWDVEQELGPTDRRLFAAVRELSEAPGAEQLSSHQRTQALQLLSGLSGNAFYSAHARIKRRAEARTHKLFTRRGLPRIASGVRSSR